MNNSMFIHLALKDNDGEYSEHIIEGDDVHYFYSFFDHCKTELLKYEFVDPRFKNIQKSSELKKRQDIKLAKEDFKYTLFKDDKIIVEFINPPGKPVGWSVKLDGVGLAEGHANLFDAMLSAVDCYRWNQKNIEDGMTPRPKKKN